MISISAGYLPVEHDAVQPEGVLLRADRHPALQVEVLLRGDAHMARQRLVGGQPREVLAPLVAIGGAAEHPLGQRLGEGDADRAPAELPHEGERLQLLVRLEPEPEVQDLGARP